MRSIEHLMTVQMSQFQVQLCTSYQHIVTLLRTHFIFFGGSRAALLQCGEYGILIPSTDIIYFLQERLQRCMVRCQDTARVMQRGYAAVVDVIVCADASRHFSFLDLIMIADTIRVLGDGCRTDYCDCASCAFPGSATCRSKREAYHKCPGATKAAIRCW
jgi:hypothetical protein